LAATLSYFDTGRFLRETGAGKNVVYFTAWWNYRFLYKHACEPSRMRLTGNATPATALDKARGSIDNRTPRLSKSPRDSYSDIAKNSPRLCHLR
jgi:hypothetical protein